MSDPSLTAIVVVPDTYDTVRRTISYLRAQTTVRQVELVLVVPSGQQVLLDESELACFHSWQVIEVGIIKSKAHAYAAGIRCAHAPVVALTEDHSFPDSNWAELFISAHQQSWAAVGPSMCNANPDSLLSWADFYQAYGEWTRPVASGAVRSLPGHNSSYKRDILLSYGNQLEDLMEAENILHRHMVAQGYKLFFESRTCTAHLNFGTWSSWLPERYYTGRQFASTWAKSWTRGRRLLFTLASPLIPFVRLWRVQKRVRRGQSLSLLMRLIPVFFIGLLVEGIGYMVGYAAGAGDSIEKMEKYEYHRDKFSGSVNRHTESGTIT